MREIKFEICTQCKDGTDSVKEVLTINQLIDYRLSSDRVLLYKRQYIGLKTGDGVEVYDADIIQYSSSKINLHTGSKVPNSETTQTKIVEWSTKQQVAGWQLRLIDTTELYIMTGEKFGIGNIDGTHIGVYLKNAKIIGNIYDDSTLSPIHNKP